MCIRDRLQALQEVALGPEVKQPHQRLHLGQFRHLRLSTRAPGVRSGPRQAQGGGAGSEDGEVVLD